MSHDTSIRNSPSQKTFTKYSMEGSITVYRGYHRLISQLIEGSGSTLNDRDCPRGAKEFREYFVKSWLEEGLNCTLRFIGPFHRTLTRGVECHRLTLSSPSIPHVETFGKETLEN